MKRYSISDSVIVEMQQKLQWGDFLFFKKGKFNKNSAKVSVGDWLSLTLKVGRIH